MLAVALLTLGVGLWLWNARQPSDAAQAGAAPRAALSDSEAASSSAATSLRLPRLEGEAKAAISGTVRTRGGGPIPGALVCVTADPSELRGLGSPRPSCTRSEHDGHYRIDDLWPVGVDVEASAAEHQPGKWQATPRTSRWRPQLHLQPGEQREGIDLELLPGGAKLTGVVLDISGGEIEGALVSARAGEWGDGIRAIGRSDAQGRFEIWTAPEVVELRAWAPGYASASTAALSPSSTTELYLTPESVLSGRVVHAQTGEPIAGLTVSAHGSGFRSNNDAVRSDADGNFRLTGLTPGVYKPAAAGDNFYGEVATQVHLGLGQSSEPIEIRVHEVALVEGRIVEAGTNQGCADGGLTLTEVETKKTKYARTDADGRVIVRALLPGTYDVGVDCLGRLSEPEYPQLEVDADNLVGLVWEVREGLALRGVVVDEQGDAVAQMRAYASMRIDANNARSQAPRSYSLETEADGAFEIAGLLPGTYDLGVWGDRPTLDEPLKVELESGADRNDLRVVLPATGSIRGRVVDESGVGQANVAIEAWAIAGSRRAVNTRTDDAGNFALDHVIAGEVRVRATNNRWGDVLRRPGTDDDDLQGETVSVAAGGEASVELVVESRTGVIRGRVFDETGAPVDDAFVHAERMSDSATANQNRSRNAVRWDFNATPHLSEADGSFVIDGLSEGTYVVRAHRKGGGEAIAEGIALGSSVDLTIVPTGVLAGIVRVEGGSPPERFSITARDPAAGLYTSDSYFRTDGRWELRELAAGTYTISVDSAAGNGELVVELQSGAVQDQLEIVLQPRVTLKGRLVDADTREPVAGMKVSVAGRAGGFNFGWNDKPGPEISDEQGNFVVENAATGRVQLFILPRNFNRSGDYGSMMLHRTIATEPEVQDLGELGLIAQRLKPGEAAGDLGFALTQTDPAVEPEDIRLTVGLIHPGGPAENTGLEVGDVIEAIDGKSVLGDDSSLYWNLSAVPPGTVLELKLAGDKQVRITAGPPRK